MSRAILEDHLSKSEATQFVQDGKTLQEISDIIFERVGQRWSTAGVSKLCRKYGIQMPRSGPRSGSLHKGWKGGVVRNRAGYIEVYCPNHPHQRKHTKYVLQHRLVMEEHLGRFLAKSEVVHHKNGDKTDNRIENLELFSSNAEHLAATLKGNVPKWTKEGKRRIADGQKNRTRPPMPEEQKHYHRCRCLLWNAIHGELKLGAPPKREDIDRCLEQRGMSYHDTLQKVVEHGLQHVFPHHKPKRGSLRKSRKPSVTA